MCIRDSINAEYMGDYLNYKLIFGYPSLAIGVLLPVLLVLYLRLEGQGLVKHKDNITVIRGLSSTAKEKLKVMMARFSYVFISYDSRRYFWEGVSTLWSSLIVVYTVYLPFDSSSSQSFSLVILPIVLFALQYFGRPYLDNHLNSIALTCIKCAILSSLCCLGLRANSRIEIIKTIYITSIIVANISLLIYVFASLREDARNKMEIVVKTVEGQSSSIARILVNVLNFLTCGRYSSSQDASRQAVEMT
eukprot:TRINITY_DN4472_c0_g1_i1.p1 TRINITY_DN4472_c0_g1~~TRINITY_DN4472_c0_g1_i1.p1  ORF type:complete len:271 (-),score=23.22 TRINITY_DN4472_c0_g1_i1:88-831(-)